MVTVPGSVHPVPTRSELGQHRGALPVHRRRVSAGRTVLFTRLLNCGRRGSFLLLIFFFPFSLFFSFPFLFSFFFAFFVFHFFSSQKVERVKSKIYRPPQSICMSTGVRSGFLGEVAPLFSSSVLEMSAKEGINLPAASGRGWSLHPS